MRPESYDLYGFPNSVGVPEDGLDTAIKIWKGKLRDSDTIMNLKNRKQYVKPSVENRKQMNKAKYYQKLEADKIKRERKRSTCWSDKYMIIPKPK